MCQCIQFGGENELGEQEVHRQRDGNKELQCHSQELGINSAKLTEKVLRCDGSFCQMKKQNKTL